jgi:hypothetical protein
MNEFAINTRTLLIAPLFFSRDITVPANHQIQKAQQKYCWRYIIFGETRKIIEPKSNEARELAVGFKDPDGGTYWVYSSRSKTAGRSLILIFETYRFLRWRNTHHLIRQYRSLPFWLLLPTIPEKVSRVYGLGILLENKKNPPHFLNDFVAGPVGFDPTTSGSLQ